MATVGNPIGAPRTTSMRTRGICSHTPARSQAKSQTTATTGLVGLAGILLLGATLPIANADDHGLKALEGTWRMVECVNTGGRQDPELIKEFRLVIKGNVHDEINPAEIVHATIRVDEATNPKSIDTTFTSGAQKNETTKGIYKLEGDRLTICRNHTAERPRPEKFESPEFTFVVLIVWERVPAKAE
jgi:uncharacterized protein (TIGR03067 family)